MIHGSRMVEGKRLSVYITDSASLVISVILCVYLYTQAALFFRKEEFLCS